jgi:hypothetical protein
MKRVTVKFSTAVLCCLISQMSAATINPAVEYTSMITTSNSEPFTLGYEFTTTVALSINALGYWSDGEGNSHQVGIWSTSGDLLVSTTVQPTDPVVNSFQWDFISNYPLAAGTYVIGGEYLGNYDTGPYKATGITTIAGYTWVEDRQLYGAGLNFPTHSSGGAYGDNGLLAVDFSVNSAPEPASFVLASLGLAGLAAAIRRRRTARACTGGVLRASLPIFCAALPDHDKRSPEEIIGFDEHGLPG